MVAPALRAMAATRSMSARLGSQKAMRFSLGWWSLLSVMPK